MEAEKQHDNKPASPESNISGKLTESTREQEEQKPMELVLPPNSAADSEDANIPVTVSERVKIS